MFPAAVVVVVAFLHHITELAQGKIISSASLRGLHFSSDDGQKAPSDLSL
jgi:hypothetical protein